MSQNKSASSAEICSLKAGEFLEGRGVVAFLDILGYQSFLSNNDSNQGMREVLDILNDVPAQVIEMLREKTKKGKHNHYFETKMFPNIKTMIFSDTIVVTAMFPDDYKDTEKASLWVTFQYVIANAYARFMEHGLPVRGAITTGDFMISGASLAGKPIVKAHEISSKLDLSICVIDEAVMQMVNQFQKKDWKSSVCIEYLVPLKDGAAKFHVIAPKFEPEFYDGDIRQFVLESFWKHQKDIPPSACRKVDNTEMFLRFLKMKRNIQITEKEQKKEISQ